jgi:hypothetical protein
MRKKSLTKHVAVLFDEETHQKIIKITDSREMPISAFIRKVVLYFLNYHDKKGGFKNGTSN